MTTLHHRAIAGVLAAGLLTGGFALARIDGSGTRPTAHQVRAEQAREASARGGVNFSIGDRDGTRTVYVSPFIEPTDSSFIASIPAQGEMMVHSITIANGLANSGATRGGNLALVPEGSPFTQFVANVPDEFGTLHFTFPQPISLRETDLIYFTFTAPASAGPTFWEITMIGRPFSGARMDVR